MLRRIALLVQKYKYRHRMLTYADVCWQGGDSKHTDLQHLRQAPPPPHLPSLLSPPSFSHSFPLFFFSVHSFPLFFFWDGVSRGLVGVGRFGGVRLGLSYSHTHTSACVSVRQHASAYAQRTSRQGWRSASWSVLFRC